MNTNIANVLSDIQGGEAGGRGGQSSRMGGMKGTEEELEERKR